MRESERFFAKLRPHMLGVDLEQVETAYVFSKYAHRNQLRDGGGRYFNHPRAVTLIIGDELRIFDWQILVTGLLHDVPEDTYMLTEHRLILNFGREVAFWIKLVTKVKGQPYLEPMIQAGIWQVFLVKLADRLHNLRELASCTPEKISRQVAETKEKYLPLVDLLIKIIPSELRPKAEYLKAQIELELAKYEAKT